MDWILPVLLGLAGAAVILLFAIGILALVIVGSAARGAFEHDHDRRDDGEL